MKVGFDLEDDVLVGVAMASFSVIMSMNGWHASAAEYGALVADIGKDIKSDYFRVRMLHAGVTRGMWYDLDLTIQQTEESLSLARNLQDTQIWREQIICRIVSFERRKREPKTQRGSETHKRIPDAHVAALHPTRTERWPLLAWVAFGKCGDLCSPTTRARLRISRSTPSG